MRKPNTAKAAPEAQDLRQRAVQARDAAGRFNRLRERSDVQLLALAPAFEAAVDLYQQRIDEENAVVAAAGEDGWPGPAPEGSGAEWQAWFRQKEDWRERTGVAAAEEASGEAGTALFQIEERIADLPAASLAGLKLKARVARRSEDIGQEWVVGLGEGLVRDLLAFTDSPARQPAAAVPSLVGMLDLASASLEELQALHDIADLVGGVAYAVCWQSRAHARGWKEQSPPGDHYNAAGKLMQWLGDALTDVETAVNREVARRAPADNCERETRLSMRARLIIDNGDPEQIEMFARELLDHAAAGRKRH